jgi:sigma-B regulation protein RsbU (phosphoserine phosphatase)
MVTSKSPVGRYRWLLFAMAIVFAVATVVYSAGWMYYIRMGTVELGIDTLPTAGGIEITNIYKGSPAEGAGLRTHDLIVAINGRVLTSEATCSETLQDVWLQSRPGDHVDLQIRRAGQAQPVLITGTFRAAVGRGDKVPVTQRVANVILNAYPVLFLVVGLVVLFLRIEDGNAWLLALVFATFISASSLPDAAAVAPVPLREFLHAYRAIFYSLISGLFYFFFAVFPTRSPIDRKARWLKWLLLAVDACLGFGGIHSGEPEVLPFLSGLASRTVWGNVRIVIGNGTIVLGVVSLLMNVLRASNRDDSRKLKVILWGTVVGITPAVVARLIGDVYNVHIPFWVEVAYVVCLFLFPLSFAYAVVKHRVLEIPVLLKRSARYFIVERGFVFLILLLAVGATFWLADIFSTRFPSGSRAAIPVGATFGVLLISGGTQVHRRIRTRLDRAFFRSSYDAQQILENLASTILTVTNREGLASLLQQHIHDALHPQSTYVYLDAGNGQLLAYAGDPPAGYTALPPGGDGLAELSGRNTPMEVDHDSTDGTHWEALGAEYLVPIRGTAEGQLQGLATLGPRLSEEPYSTSDRRLLASVASQAGIAMRSIVLAERMAASMEVERRTEQEMQIARQVQSRLLPQETPSLRTLDCAGKCIQTRAVGGDYYDFLEFGSGRLGLVLADISGKGMPGALLMANLQASLRSQYATALDDLPGLLRSVNRLFFNNSEAAHYATMFFALYDDETRRLRYVNCGHNPPFLLRRDGGVERLRATATVLGLFEEWDCEVNELELAGGDVLVIYTDGISEASPDGEDEFGEDRLLEVLKQHQQQSAGQVLDGVFDEVQRFSQGEQADDMTLIVARCR